MKNLSFLITVFTLLLFQTKQLLPIDVSLPLFARYFPGETPFSCCSGASSIDFRFGGTVSQCSSDQLPTKLLAHSTTQSFAFIWNYHPTNYVFSTVEIPFYRIKYKTNTNDSPLTSKHAGPIACTIGLIASPETTDLDFLDFSVETGFITPNSAPCCTGCGTPIKISCSTGLFDWISTGLEADAILFYSVNDAIQYNTCWYIKADHLVRGLSAMLGYSYSYQSPAQKECRTHTNQNWNMSTFHLGLSYDLAQADKPYLPSFEFFYNRILSGKGIVWNNVCGFTIASAF